MGEKNKKEEKIGRVIDRGGRRNKMIGKND